MVGRYGKYFVWYIIANKCMLVGDFILSGLRPGGKDPKPLWKRNFIGPGPVTF